VGRRPGSPNGERLAGQGAPKLTLRLTPEQLAEVQARGGAAWAREVLLAALGESPDTAFAAGFLKACVEFDIGEEHSKEEWRPLAETIAADWQAAGRPADPYSYYMPPPRPDNVVEFRRK